MENKKNNKNKIVLILRIVFIIILIFSIVKIVEWVMNNKENKEIMQNLVEIVEVVDKESDEKYEVKFNKLKEINSDTVGWLKVNNTKIEYPVVKTNDNSYYLSHNFEKNQNKAGWIFMDYENKLDGKDKNIVIYGHNMKDGSMFGTLKNVLTEEWYDNEKNQYIIFATENEYQKYIVFSIYQVEKEDYYIQTKFKDEEFQKFIDKITKRSIKDFNVEVLKDDSILTLSTCASNNKYRVVLHAKKYNN